MLFRSRASPLSILNNRRSPSRTPPTYPTPETHCRHPSPEAFGKTDVRQVSWLAVLLLPSLLVPATAGEQWHPSVSSRSQWRGRSGFAPDSLHRTPCEYSHTFYKSIIPQKERCTPFFEVLIPRCIIKGDPARRGRNYRRGYFIFCRYFLKPGIANLSTPRDSSSTIPAATRRPRYFDA